MHAQCCGLSDTVYRVLVNRQSADSVDCWPCPSCARRNSAASRSPRQQQSPRAASANPSPASGHRQRSPSAVTGNPLARGRRRGRQGTTATVSRPVTMSRSPRQHQSTRAASGNPPAQSSHGSVTFVTVARGELRLCYGGYSYTKKAEKKNRIRWECSQRKPQQCKGAVTTSLVVRFTYVYRHSDYRYVKRHTAL